MGTLNTSSNPQEFVMGQVPLLLHFSLHYNEVIPNLPKMLLIAMFMESCPRIIN